MSLTGDEMEYKTNTELESRLLKAFIGKDEENFKDAVQSASSFQLDKRFPELNYRTLLHAAAHEGNEIFAEILITAGASVNYNDFRQFMPIHYASENGIPEMIKLLLRNNAKVNEQNAFGETPAHILAKLGHTDGLVELMADEKLDLSLTNKDGRTALQEAVKSGLVTTKKLLEKKELNRQPREIDKAPLYKTSPELQEFSSLNVTIFLIAVMAALFAERMYAMVHEMS